MKTLTFEKTLRCSVETLYDFHADTANLPKVTPPGISVTILKMTLPLRSGSDVTLRIRRGLIAFTWIVAFETMRRPDVIVDVAKRSPFKHFRHEHRFTDNGDGTSTLRDTVAFALPFSPFSRPLEWLIAKDMHKMFAYRHAQTAVLLESGPA